MRSDLGYNLKHPAISVIPIPVGFCLEEFPCTLESGFGCAIWRFVQLFKNVSNFTRLPQGDMCNQPGKRHFVVNTPSVAVTRGVLVKWRQS